ncbi:MAG: hypothetical protein IPM29_10250 [Planctomycetes bacterium]|nr:hypothetical protein [Planctomycetota bacterium]
MTALPETGPSPRRRRSRFVRALRIGVALAVLFAGLLLALPALASTRFARHRIEAALTEALGARVQVAELGIGWFSGARFAGLQVDQPAAFAAHPRLLAVQSFDGSVSLPALVRGRLDVRGVIDGLELRVVQDASGALNLEQLGRGGRSRPRRAPSDGGGGDTSLDDVRLDLQLREAMVEIVREPLGVVERMERVHLAVSKPYGSGAVRVRLDADLRGSGTPEQRTGMLSLLADVPVGDERPLEAALRCTALDLARYEPIVASLVEPGALERLAGVLDADVQLQGDPARELRMRGRIALAEPRLAGSLFAGMHIESPAFEVVPELAIAWPTPGAAPQLDLSALRVELGFLRAQGLANDAAGRPGLSFEIDVEKLASFGGPLPARLAGSGLRTSGAVRAPWRDDLAELQLGELLGIVSLDARVELGRLELGGQQLTDVGAEVRLDGGCAELATTRGRLQGGALRLSLRSDDCTALRDARVAVGVGLEGAQVTSGAVAALRYAVPLFAGLDPNGIGAALDARLGLTLELAGPVAPQPEQPLLAWLDRWAGTGDLQLRDGRFQPAPQLAGLLEVVGQQRVLSFDDFGTSFRLREGFVESGLTKLAAAGREIGITGRTGLSGAIDYTLDVRDMLRGHRDGERILRFLGAAPLGAQLTGSLDAPRFAPPDLAELARRALEATLRDQGENLLRDVLRGRAPGRDGPDDGPRDGSDTGQPGGGEPERPQDAIRKAGENLLRGILGGQRRG